MPGEVVPFSVWVSDNPESFQNGVAGKIIEAGGKPRESYFYLDSKTFEHVNDPANSEYAERLKTAGIVTRNIDDMYEDIKKNAPSSLRDVVASNDVNTFVDNFKSSAETLIEHKKFAQASDMIRTIASFDPEHAGKKVLYSDADMKFAPGITVEKIAETAPDKLPNGAQFVATFPSRKKPGVQSMQTRSRALDVLFDKQTPPKGTVTINNGAFIAEHNDPAMARIACEQEKNAKTVCEKTISMTDCEDKEKKVNLLELMQYPPKDILNKVSDFDANQKKAFGINESITRVMVSKKVPEEHKANEVIKHLDRHMTSKLSILAIGEEVQRQFGQQQGEQQVADLYKPKLTKLAIPGPKERLRQQMAATILSPHEAGIMSLQNVGSWKQSKGGACSPGTPDVFVSDKSGTPSPESRTPSVYTPSVMRPDFVPLQAIKEEKDAAMISAVNNLAKSLATNLATDLTTDLPSTLKVPKIQEPKTCIDR